MYISKKISVVHGQCRKHHIFRMTRIRIQRNKGNHAANLKFRINLMPLFYYQSTRQQFMMHHLIHTLFRIFFLRKDHSRACISKQWIFIIFLIIDFIESHPILYLVFIPLHNRQCVFYKKINQLSIFPTTILFYKVIWHFKMRKCNHRLNSIFQKFIKQIIIKLKPGFIWLLIITIRKYSCPCNGRAKTLKSHLSK